MHALTAGVPVRPGRSTCSGCCDVVRQLVVEGRLSEGPGTLRFPLVVLIGGAEVVQPGNEIAAGAGNSNRLMARQADREQVLGALKAAFVQGRLTKDEFDQRVGQVLAAYAELDALTADIPAGPTETQLRELARESHNRKVIQRGTAAGAGASMGFTAVMVGVAGGSPAVGLVAVPVVGSAVAVLLAGLLTLLSWILEKGSGRQLSPGLPCDPGGKAPQPLASADSAKPLPRTTHGPRHAAEVAQSRYYHPRTPRAAVQGV